MLFTLLFIWSKDSVRKKKIAFLIPTILFGVYNFTGVYGKVPLATCDMRTLICMIGMGMSGVCILYLYNGKSQKDAEHFQNGFSIFFILHTY